MGVAATGWKARTSCLSSAHEQPYGQSTATKPIDELGPGEAVSIERKRSHHQIQDLFVFPNQGRAVGRVQLWNLFEFDLSELGQRRQDLPPLNSKGTAVNSYLNTLCGWPRPSSAPILLLSRSRREDGVQQL